MNEKLRKIADVGFWTAQSVSLASIVHDLSFQELIRERVGSGEMVLGPISHFLNEHFVGDIGNAYAAIGLLPVVLELVNLEISKYETVATWIKETSNFVTKISPYVMAALFLGVAHNVEMSTNIIQAGTGDQLDMVGAAWGVMTALPAVVRFNKKVFHNTQVS